MQKSCWDSSENPSERVLGGPKITKKNCTFTNTYFTTLFFEEKIGKSAKNDSNMGPKT